MNYECINFEQQDGVAVLTLNRPECLNAFNVQMHREIRKVLKQIEENPQVRTLLLTGAGRGFCAGQDLNERKIAPPEVPEAEAAPPDLGATLEENYNPLIRKLRSLKIPVIAAVNGVAAGAGANLALACDIVFAAKSAKFIQSFCKIALIPDSGGTYFLPRLIGEARAKGLALTGEAIDAETAERWGMIWKAADDQKLMTEAMELAKHLATQPTQALGEIKNLLQQSFGNTLDEQLELEKNTQQILGRSKNYREGVTAFFEKRTPIFE